jgi:hypothetical protein
MARNLCPPPFGKNVRRQERPHPVEATVGQKGIAERVERKGEDHRRDEDQVDTREAIDEISAEIEAHFCHQPPDRSAHQEAADHEEHQHALVLQPRYEVECANQRVRLIHLGHAH